MTAHPNIIYILADDLGYGDLSCLNPESKIRTQHIDRIAREGMRFTDAHASSAVCTPSRYSILTGRYNWRSARKQGVGQGYTGPLIEPGRETVASFLRSTGYVTGCIGKWHLGWNWAKTGSGEDEVDFSKPIEGGPCAVGFDEYFGIAASLDMPPYVFVRNDQPTARPDRTFPGEGRGKRLARSGPQAPDFDHGEVQRRFTDEAIDFINRHAGGGAPFFLYLPLASPHTPILPRPEFQGKSGTNEYGDFCLEIDHDVGRILDALDRHDIAANTVIAFTSDNGSSPLVDFEELGALGHRPSYHFRGHKADIYEGGHRIPLVVRWPDVIGPGQTCDETVCLADLLATCADIVGRDLPEDAGEDSVSHLPLWRGESLDHALREATVHHSVDGSFSIRRGRWKLEMCAGSGGWSHPRPGKECAGLPPRQLYDLDADIGETRNVIDQHNAVAEELEQLLTTCVENGRSTPGPPQPNTGSPWWEQLWWIDPPGAG